MELFIKNLGCIHCKMLVKAELEKLGLHCISIGTGKVEIKETISPATLKKIEVFLQKSGLELLTNKKRILVKKIKIVIIEMIQDSEGRLKTNFSDYLSEKLGLDYTYLANIFSEQEGSTIEHCIILNKVQRIKELLEHNELNLTEISWKLQYSSVAHLSTQFKKITGVSPSHFKQAEKISRLAV